MLGLTSAGASGAPREEFPVIGDNYSSSCCLIQKCYRAAMRLSAGLHAPEIVLRGRIDCA
jgi:hypothetical protein